MTTLHVTGRPEPQPEQEAEVRRVLKDLDELLDIRWFPTAHFCARTQQLEGRYALICQWPKEDKRWRDYQNGLIHDPVDIIGWFTKPAGEQEDWFETEALPVDPEAVIERALAHLARMDNTRFPWAERMKSASERNAAQRRRVMVEAQEEMLEGFKYYHKYFRGEPVVALNEGRQLEKVPLPAKTRL